MTRPLISLTAFACILTALSALALRYELYAPGVTAVFSTSDGDPDGALFNQITWLHRLLCALTVMLLGTTMTALARTRGAALATPLMILGTAFSLTTITILVLAAIPLSQPSGIGVGWTLYPPLSSAQSLLDRAMVALGLDPLLLGFVGSYIFIPALLLLYSGAFMMLATLPRARWIGALGTAATAVAVMPSISNGALGDISAIAALQILAALFTVTATAYQITNRAPWLSVLTLGAALPLITYSLVTDRIDMSYLDATTAQIALNYMFPLGFAWFALPAAMMMNGANDTPLKLATATPFMIAVPLIAWIAPLVLVGIQGQPHSYIDYPDAFADLNRTISIAVLVFIIAYTALLIRLHRVTR